MNASPMMANSTSWAASLSIFAPTSSTAVTPFGVGQLATIAGRENEPAGTVFKNVKLHKTMPAKEFVTMMDEQFGRGLGINCTGCHMDNKDYASDARKDKIIAMQMIKMQRDIDAKYIAKVKELDDPRPKTTCVMCHRGAGHLTNEMDVPTAPVPQRKRG